MKVLIVFYDRSSLKNLVATLGIMPDRVMYFYDPDVFSYKEIHSTYDVCKKYIPHLQYEIGKIHEHDYDQVVETIDSYIDACNGDDIYLDLTGGSELSVIAGYAAGMKKQCHLYFTDIKMNNIFNLHTHQTQYRSLPFEIDDMIEAFGGKIISYTDSKFLDYHQKKLLPTAKYILSHLDYWLKTCQYFQKHNVKLRQNKEIHFSGSFETQKKYAHKIPEMDIVHVFSKQRLITNLLENKNSFSFDYTTTTFMDMISTYGVWLELFVYYHLLQIKELHDVRTSIKVDWNTMDQYEIIGNEIDVTAMYQCQPVVISCKQSKTPIGAEPLNELYVVSRRIGGKYAIPILVTCSDIKGKHPGIYMKAKEMGLHLLDISDVASENFGVRLRRIITGNKK